MRNGTRALWRITVTPAGDGDMIIVLPVPGSCDGSAAACQCWQGCGGLCWATTPSLKWTLCQRSETLGHSACTATPSRTLSHSGIWVV